VASTEALHLLHWAMHVVSYWQFAMATKFASKVGVFFHCPCFAWDPVSQQVDPEQVVA
jgi:hypothetical protein